MQGFHFSDDRIHGNIVRLVRQCRDELKIKTNTDANQRPTFFFAQSMNRLIEVAFAITQPIAPLVKKRCQAR